MTARSAISAAAVLLSMAVAEAAAACQCARFPPVAEVQKEAVYVVTGVVAAAHPSVVSSRRVTPEFGDLPLLYPVTNFEIAVTRSFGRPAPKTIELTHIGCCVCEAPLEVGKTYLLFVIPSWDVRGASMVSICDPNAPIDRAGPLLAQLPKGTPYVPLRKASLLASMRWHVLAVANRVVTMRMRGFRLTFGFLFDSPFVPFIAEMAGVIFSAVVVIMILRRIHHS